MIAANVQDGAGRSVPDAPQPVLQAARLHQDSLLLLSADARLNAARPAPRAWALRLQLTVGGPEASPVWGRLVTFLANCNDKKGVLTYSETISS